MDLSRKECHVALKARDSRFDGRFFVCVASTRIYCRPVCPARTPRFENCSFVGTAAAAESSGYRACLRCRPETAPGSAAWLGTESTVRRALRIICDPVEDAASVQSLASRVGVTDRHLRRLFNEHLGATPVAIMQTERLATARQLLLETEVPVADVALASGFGSVRRFNDATRAAFAQTPSEVRRRSGRDGGRTGDACQVYRFHLAYRPPYDWSSLLDYFRARSISGLESVTGLSYSRAISIGDAAGTLTVTPDMERNRLEAQFRLDRPTILPGAVRRVRDFFDLDAAPADIGEHLAQDRLLRRVVRRHPGLRIPGCWDVFEMLVRAIVGQQISVQAATTVLGRLVARHGRPLDEAVCGHGSAAPTLLFPRPVDLVGRDLGKAGLTRARADTLARVAALFADDPQLIDMGMDFDTARERLLEIRGIGPWTADYVALRALRDPDAFLGTDLGVIKAADAGNARQLARRAERWRPWRGYAVAYLWKTLT